MAASVYLVISKKLNRVFWHNRVIYGYFKKDTNEYFDA